LTASQFPLREPGTIVGPPGSITGSAAVPTGDPAMTVAWRSGSANRRRLVTEREIIALARAAVELPTDAIMTPTTPGSACERGLRGR
jgi:hypothetical protein